VVHLHRRAGFAATWDELQHDLHDGPAPSIDRLLAGKARARGVPDNFASFADTLARLAVEGQDVRRLKAWWVYRMLFGPDPLSERLALMWHNHFATGARKVGLLVRGQNELFRRHARAPFGDLLRAVVHDPALLVWLDAPSNRKAHPNENLARELMELFTLGIGHYTETDVKEAARALTGWTVVDDRFHDDAFFHDVGAKTILGQTGAWTGDDLVRMLLDHPATAERLAARLCELLIGEGAVQPETVRALASGLRERRLDIGWGLETVLRSAAFFAEANLGTRVQGPAECVIGAARALELFDPAPNSLVLGDWLADLGLDLFNPPNVGGWPGGRAWLSARALLGRTNYAAALLGGADVGLPGPADALDLARRHGHGRDLEEVVSCYADLLLGGTPGPAWRDRLLAALGRGASAEPETVRRAVVLIMASPEAQLG
jgi:uncharacterized protein (DUF1800 family)